MVQDILFPPVIDWDEKERKAFQIIDEALEKYNLTALLACISGGNDSVAMATLMRKHPAVRQALKIDTQTGIEEGDQFVRDFCKESNLELFERKSNVSYEELAARYGMLGKSQHFVYFNALKGRVFRALGMELAPNKGEKILLISGARKQESLKRKKTVVAGPKQDPWEKRLVWASPLHDWSKLECQLYLQREGVEPNFVAQVLHRSGECNCGAFGSKEELDELRLWYPATAEKLDRAMEIAKEAGKWAEWGVPVPDWFGKKEIGGLDDYLEPICEQTACQSCPMRGNGEEE